jgi:predicted DNA-binding transcriptional regulator YafY
MKKIVFALLLLMSLSSSIPAQGRLLSRDEIDSLLGSGTTFSRDEVIELIVGILALADEELRRTTEEAVKAALLQTEPERAFQASLAESWKAEAARAGRMESIFKTLSIVEAAAIGALSLYIGIRERLR